MNDSMMDDPFEGLLGGNGADPPPALRERLRQTTLGHVRHRRRVRRLGQACAAAAVLLAVTVWYSLSGPPPDDGQQALVKPLPPPVTPAVTAPSPARISAAELEWQAFDSLGEDRSRRYFEAGNRYLEVEADYSSALRCYSQALADASPRELEFGPNDSWLLLTLKNARRQGVN
jgi:hypothetical protein